MFISSWHTRDRLTKTVKSPPECNRTTVPSTFDLPQCVAFVEDMIRVDTFEPAPMMVLLTLLMLTHQLTPETEQRLQAHYDHLDRATSIPRYLAPVAISLDDFAETFTGSVDWDNLKDDYPDGKDYQRLRQMLPHTREMERERHTTSQARIETERVLIKIMSNHFTLDKLAELPPPVDYEQREQYRNQLRGFIHAPDFQHLDPEAQAALRAHLTAPPLQPEAIPKVLEDPDVHVKWLWQNATLNEKMNSGADVLVDAVGTATDESDKVKYGAYIQEILKSAPLTDNGLKNKLQAALNVAEHDVFDNKKLRELLTVADLDQADVNLVDAWKKMTEFLDPPSGAITLQLAFKASPEVLERKWKEEHDEYLKKLQDWLGSATDIEMRENIGRMWDWIEVVNDPEFRGAYTDAADRYIENNPLVCLVHMHLCKEPNKEPTEQTEAIMWWYHKLPLPTHMFDDCDTGTRHHGLPSHIEWTLRHRLTAEFPTSSDKLEMPDSDDLNDWHVLAVLTKMMEKSEGLPNGEAWTRRLEECHKLAMAVLTGNIIIPSSIKNISDDLCNRDRALAKLYLNDVANITDANAKRMLQDLVNGNRECITTKQEDMKDMGVVTSARWMPRLKNILALYGSITDETKLESAAKDLREAQALLPKLTEEEEAVFLEARKALVNGLSCVTQGDDNLLGALEDAVDDLLGFCPVIPNCYHIKQDVDLRVLFEPIKNLLLSLAEFVPNDKLIATANQLDSMQQQILMTNLETHRTQTNQIINILSKQKSNQSLLQDTEKLRDNITREIERIRPQKTNGHTYTGLRDFRMYTNHLLNTLKDTFNGTLPAWLPKFMASDKEETAQAVYTALTGLLPTEQKIVDDFVAAFESWCDVPPKSAVTVVNLPNAPQTAPTTVSEIKVEPVYQQMIGWVMNHGTKPVHKACLDRILGSLVHVRPHLVAVIYTVMVELHDCDEETLEKKLPGGKLVVSSLDSAPPPKDLFTTLLKWQPTDTGRHEFFARSFLSGPLRCAFTHLVMTNPQMNFNESEMSSLKLLPPASPHLWELQASTADENCLKVDLPSLSSKK